MINLPVTFKYFDKLKLYQGFLLSNSFSETTKRTYWVYEKLILRWAYSSGHQHLGSPIGTDKLKHLFGIENREPEITPRNEYEKTVLANINSEDGMRKLLPILGNLYVKGLADPVDFSMDGEKKGWVEMIRINNSGFLIGEILTEKTFTRYVKYELGGILIKFLTLVLVLTVVLAFINQIIELFC